MKQGLIFPDYHLHTSFSSDCDANIHNIIKAAKDSGLNSICVTDHYDMDFPVRDDEPDMDFYLDADSYYKYMSEIREQYAPSFDLRIGIELGVMDTTADKLNDYALSHPEFDFIIASSHIIDGLDPYYPEYFEGRSAEDAYRSYFESILYNVEHFKNYNVYGHLDYVLRYGTHKKESYDMSIYMDIFEEIFKHIIYDGKGIEINTGSLYGGLNFPHPHSDILKLYKDMGGEIITVGSDAHKPCYVGYGFDVARKVLLEHDFKYYCTYKKQKPTFVVIE